MNAKNEILEELRLLSATVNTISRETPYEAPAGYFDGFPARVLRLIGAEETGHPFDVPFEEEEPSFSFEKDKPLGFSVPEGYFEGFAQGLLDKIKAGGVTDDVKAELTRLSPLLSGISRKTPYQAPEGYFEELSSIEAILAEVRERPLYEVPAGYFAGLADEVLGKISRPARVISLNQGSRQSNQLGESKQWAKRSLWKYSAAAVVAGLIFTIGWLRLHTATVNHPAAVDIAGNLVNASDQELQNYLDDQNDQNIAVAEPMNNTVTLDINDSDVKSLLGDVPDGDLKQYMEEHGGPDDIATN